MKVKITRKDELTWVRECSSWKIGVYTHLMWLLDSDGNKTYACTDWLDCEVVDE